MRAALSTLGEKDIPPERWRPSSSKSQSASSPSAAASAQPGDEPKVISLKAEAQKAIEAGELAKADALARGCGNGAGRPSTASLSTWPKLARRGEISLARLRYAEAATHFANAAAVFPPRSAQRTSGSAISTERQARCTSRSEFGDNGALLSAIERSKGLVDLTPRERVPLDWAPTQNNLGTALSSLGSARAGRRSSKRP